MRQEQEASLEEQKTPQKQKFITLDQALRVIAQGLHVPFIQSSVDAQERAKESIFNALHIGSITALGCESRAFQIARDDWRDNEWSHHAVERTPIPPAFWVLEGVDWQNSSIKRYSDGEYISIVLDEKELEKILVECGGSAPDANTTVAQAIKSEVDTPSPANTNNENDLPEQDSAFKPKVGAPPKFDKEKTLRYFVVFMSEQGKFEERREAAMNDFQEWMSNLLGAGHKDIPSTSWLRDKINYYDMVRISKLSEEKSRSQN